LAGGIIIIYILYLYFILINQPRLLGILY